MRLSIAQQREMPHEHDQQIPVVLRDIGVEERLEQALNIVVVVVDDIDVGT
jgi:hypothetical protein